MTPRARVAHLAPAFGIYVHIPFCISRCPYCDFNTYVGMEDTAPSYVEALLREAKEWARRAGNRAAGSIFLGGGTPSLLEPALVTMLLDGLHDAFDVDAEAEITMEANPETVSAGRLAAFRSAGVNRLSFGAQSFAAPVLETLGRAHSAGRTKEAVAAARADGFDNINLDLIFGTPGETADDWRSTLEQAMALEPEHVSAYALTIEPGTQFGADVAAGRMPAPDDDDMAEKYLVALDLLADAGYSHYEISNWARPGAACRHNLLYWTQGEYAGLGAGAHGHLDGVRSWNEKLPRTYLERVPDAIAGSERLDPVERAEEWLQLALRLVEGIDLDAAEVRLNRSVRAAAAELVGQGLMCFEHVRQTVEQLSDTGVDTFPPDRRERGDLPRRVALSRRGLLLANEATLRLVR